MNTVSSYEKLPTKSLSLLQTPLARLLSIALFGYCTAYFFCPKDLPQSSWNLFIIFLTTIVAIVAKPFPMGAISLFGFTALTLTKSVSFHSMLNAFAYDQIWLVLLACFLARGFIKTGLGKRIAYLFISFFGGSPYGIAYGLTVSSACIAPAIPSSTARTGGIFLPVLESIIDVFKGESAEEQKKIACYLSSVVIHLSSITCAMFITANAANPIIIGLAESFGVHISWMEWAKAAFIPSIASLLLLPIVLKWLVPCTVDNPGKILDHAKKELHQMGKVSWQEKILFSVFLLLILLWSCSSFFSIHATEAALIGVSLLLAANVLSWKDILSEEIAWDTFLWMSILIMMAAELQKCGMVNWCTDKLIHYIPQNSWETTLVLLSIVYYYSHYFFASASAHVSSMYGAFFMLSIGTGAPPYLTALLFAFWSNLFGALTHYSSGPAPIIFSQGHIELKRWWQIGFWMSLFHFAIWFSIGALWWKYLGMW